MPAALHVVTTKSIIAAKDVALRTFIADVWPADVEAATLPCSCVAQAATMTAEVHGMSMVLQVLYNLFEWPTLPGARMAVIGVANTFDMPERVLPKIASRLGSARVPFQPYTKAQLVTIISQRLIDSDALACFESNSLDFAARKVIVPVLAPVHSLLGRADRLGG